MNPSARAIVISSHEPNAPALNKLLESLRPQCQGKIDIVVVIGGCAWDEPLSIHESGMYFELRCMHNSFEYTALIELLHRDLAWDRYFLLHDTCVAGDTCVDKILEACPDNEECTVSFNFPSMNIGWYSTKTLNMHKTWLESMKCTDPGLLHVAKSRAVDFEDYVFKRQHQKGMHRFLGRVTCVSGPTDYYGTGVDRVVEYYASLDVYKIKANWYVRDVYQLSM